MAKVLTPAEAKTVEMKNTYPELPPEFREMSSYEEFISHAEVRKNLNLMDHALKLHKMGVPFKQFKRVINNPQSFADMKKMGPKPPSGLR
jgi:hypothetical protein